MSWKMPLVLGILEKRWKHFDSIMSSYILTVRSFLDVISKLQYTSSMKNTLNIEMSCVDDILLLLAHMQCINLAELLDKHIPVHGNRKGLRPGNVMIVWLSHILSEANHQMNHVQE
jgi:hypothetical protein